MILSFMALLALLCAGTVTAEEEYLFRNRVKLVYCDQIRNQPIFRNEDLEENCVIKVDFFDNRVSARAFQNPFEGAKTIGRPEVIMNCFNRL